MLVSDGASSTEESLAMFVYEATLLGCAKKETNKKSSISAV